MKVTKQGRIIKGIGGFYTVLADDGSTCVCKARGLFRKQAKTPLVGDIVEFSYDEEREKRERTASESFCDAAHTGRRKQRISYEPASEKKRAYSPRSRKY